MNKILLAAIVVSASAAAAQSGGLFELHLGTTANSPHAKAWSLQGPGGAAETVFLDSPVLLDAAAIASAEPDQRRSSETPRARRCADRLAD